MGTIEPVKPDKEKIELLKVEKKRLQLLINQKNDAKDATNEKYDLCKTDKHNINNLLECKNEELKTLKSHLHEKHDDSDNYRRR